MSCWVLIVATDIGSHVNVVQNINNSLIGYHAYYISYVETMPTTKEVSQTHWLWPSWATILSWGLVEWHDSVHDFMLYSWALPNTSMGFVTVDLIGCNWHRWQDKSISIITMASISYCRDLESGRRVVLQWASIADCKDEASERKNFWWKQPESNFDPCRQRLALLFPEAETRENSFEILFRCLRLKHEYIAAFGWCYPVLCFSHVAIFTILV